MIEIILFLNRMDEQEARLKLRLDDEFCRVQTIVRNKVVDVGYVRTEDMSMFLASSAYYLSKGEII